MESIIQRLRQVPGWIWLSLILFGYVLLSLVFVNDPLIYDEPAFVLKQDILTMHPPFYVGIMYLLGDILGHWNWVYRGFGLVLNVFTTIVLYKTANAIKRGAGLWTVGLYLSLPVVVQGALLIDIDNTLLVFFMAIILWRTIKNPTGLWSFLGSILLWSLILWSKVTTVYALVFFIMLWQWWHHRKIRPSCETAAAFILAWLGFQWGLFLLSRWTGMDFYGATFAHNSVGFSTLLGMLLLPMTYVRALYGLNISMLWSSPFFMVLTLGAGFLAIRKDKRSWESGLFVLTALIFLPYLVIKSTAAGFPKYVYPIYLSAALLLGSFLSGSQWKTKNRIGMLRLLFSAFLFSIFFIFIGDPLKTPFILKTSSMNLGVVVNSTISFWLSKYLLLLLVFVFGWVFLRRRNIVSLLVLLHFFYIGSLLYQQVTADYSVRYAYGEKGLSQTLDYLSMRSYLEFEVLARKHVVYYATRGKLNRLLDQEVLWSTVTVDELKPRLQLTAPAVVVINYSEFYANPQQIAILNLLKSLGLNATQRFGHYEIWEPVFVPTLYRHEYARYPQFKFKLMA